MSCSLKNSFLLKFVLESVHAIYIAGLPLPAIASLPVTRNFVFHNIGVNTFTFEDKARWYGWLICTDALYNKHPLLSTWIYIVKSYWGMLVNDNTCSLFLINGKAAFLHVVGIIMRYLEFHLMVDVKSGT